MRKIGLSILALALSVALSATGRADAYEYEIGILYDASRASSDNGAAESIRIESDSDVDDIGITGTWYFDGVAASAGPRSRAAFIGRASGVSLSYTRGSGDSNTAVTSANPFIPSFAAASESTTNSISANLHWVWPESGWYGLAGVATADIESGGEFVAADLNADAFRLGVGKYIGARTALELTVARQDSAASGAVIGGDSTSTDVAVALMHIGRLGSTWEYGTDVVLSTNSRGASDGSWNARFSLYPSRPLAFGVEIDGALEDPGDAATNYGLFASWFPRERIGIEARYGWASFDPPGNTDFDQYDFGVGVNVRF